MDSPDRILTEQTAQKWTHKYSPLIFDKGAKATPWRKAVYSTNAAGTTGHSHAKKERKIT